jgi:hypothetical protein
MSVKELCRSFDMDRYNNLGSVEEADKIVRTDDALDEFLSRASFLLVKHGVQFRFGVALLHRHYLCQDGERMSQSFQVSDGEAALVTKPVAGEANYEVEVPWLWSVSDGRYYPMEFTSDETAISLFPEDGDIAGEFLADFADFVETSPIGHLIGLAIIERELHREMSDDCTLLEYSSGNERKSTLYVRALSEAQDSIITTWAFQAAVDPMSGCVEPATQCRPIYKCRCPSGGVGETGIAISAHGNGHEAYKDGHFQIRGQHNPS